MNKTAIKNFAVWARKKLVADICYRAQLLGITEEGIKDPLPQSTGSVQFFDVGTAQPYAIGGAAISQRAHLADAIRQKAQESDYKTAYRSIVEEVAYTWFNRLIAVRFMEVNDYLPSHLRVLSSDSGKLEPDLVTRPFDADFAFSERERAEVARMQQNNAVDELFCLLFIKQCNALHELLPALFERTRDYTELLLSLSVVDREGVVYHLVHDIPEEDFDISRGGQVEIIGWLYQYYNAELKDETFALLKKNVKITKERIPPATQLFTPDWIVRYMVENSLGRLWEEGHPNSGIKANWKYYLEEAEQPVEVEQKLEALRAECRALKPQDIKVIDPCMGSGHILVYAFEVLMQIYESQGFSQRDAAQSIVENNLYGLDIDNRAAQLAYFAVMMKARQYDRRFLTRGIRPHIFAIAESNGLDPHTVNYFVGGDEGLKNDFSSLVHDLHDAKEYGSILRIAPVNFSALYARLAAVEKEGSFDALAVQSAILPLVQVAEVLSQQYDVVVTNPPYMGSSGMSAKLSDYVKNNYPDSKSDLFAVFIERCGQMTGQNRYQAMITQHAWMFLSSFEKLRKKLLQSIEVVNMAHLGARAFDEIGGEVVQTTSFVFRNVFDKGYCGTYSRLLEPTTQQGKEELFLSGQNRYTAQQTNFSKIPGSPIAYWVSDHVFSSFSNKSISRFGWASKGIITGDNARFLRLWFETSIKDIQFEANSYEDALNCSQKWYPCNKGGEFRKWYGNYDYIINWYHNGEEVIQRNTKKVRNCQDYKNEYKFIPAITWTSISSSKSSFRFSKNALSESAGMTLFVEQNKLSYILGFLNSVVAEYILGIINPTLNFTAGSISDAPLVLSEKYTNVTVSKVNNNIKISGVDWDSYETSWDFKKHPLV